MTDLNIINGKPLLDQPLRIITDIDSEDSDYSYIGYADAKVTTSQPYWRIIRIYTSGEYTETTFANNTPDFVHIWEDRESYTYINSVS